MADKIAHRDLIPLAPGWRAVWFHENVASIQAMPALAWDPDDECAYALTWDDGAWQVCSGVSYGPPDMWLGPGEDDEEVLEEVGRNVEMIDRMHR